jgi:hypothetical protein
MCLWASYKRKTMKTNIFLAFLKSMKKGVGSISERYGSGEIFKQISAGPIL